MTAETVLGDALTSLRAAAEQLRDDGDTIAYLDITGHLRQMEASHEAKVAAAARTASGQSPWRLPGIKTTTPLDGARRRRNALTAALRAMEAAHLHLRDAAALDKAGTPEDTETIRQAAAELDTLRGRIREATP